MVMSLVSFFFLVQAADEVYVIGRGNFQIGPQFQHLFQYIAEVIAFCTIAKIVFAVVAGGIHRPGKHIAGSFDLRSDLWQVANSQWGTVLSDQVDQWDSVENEVAVFDVKPLLGKVKGLVNQVKIIVGHFLHKFE